MRRIKIQSNVTKLVALCGVLALGCTTLATGRKQFAFLPDSTMNEMGIAAFTSLKSEQPTSKDSTVNAYVKCVADQVLTALPDAGEWEVVVFDDPTPNAFALPGGKIGVHTGLLPVAKTSGQLAAVIGHEISHVLLRHGNERASQQMIAEGVLTLAQSTTAGLSSKQQGLIMQGLGMGGQMGVLLPFSRKHESEADEYGQLIMAHAGFDPVEAVHLWMNMAELSQGQAPPEFMSTHPASTTRIEQLHKNLEKTEPIYNEARAQGNVPNCKRPAIAEPTKQ
ncbi:MAG: M48 family metallopeptidase [Polyangiales bacterium]